MKTCLDCTHCLIRFTPALPHYCQGETPSEIGQRLLDGDPLPLRYARLDYEQKIRCAKEQWINKQGVQRTFKDFENLRKSESLSRKYLSRAESCVWYDGNEHI